MKVVSVQYVLLFKFMVWFVSGRVRGVTTCRLIKRKMEFIADSGIVEILHVYNKIYQ